MLFRIMITIPVTSGRQKGSGIMAMEPNEKVKAFKSLIQQKIQKLIGEFAEGMISREQFHVIYERYTSQLAMADMAAMMGAPDAVICMLQDGPPTIAVKEAHMGKA